MLINYLNGKYFTYVKDPASNIQVSPLGGDGMKLRGHTGLRVETEPSTVPHPRW